MVVSSGTHRTAGPSTKTGKVFVLTSEHSPGANGAGRDFLGHCVEDLSGGKVLDLVHEQDFPEMSALISESAKRPGESLLAEIRFRDAFGGWRRMEAAVQHVPEAHAGAGGMFLLDVRGDSVGEIGDLHEQASPEMEEDLQKALKEGQFHLLYQPKVSLKTGGIVGMEALLRWDRPLLDPVGPDEFIPLAERTGLIIPLGRWVLEEACRQARDWQERHPGVDILWMSVNLSGKQLQDPLLAEEVARVLSRTGLAPANLSLEITETALIDDVASAVECLWRLKVIGVRIEIDDFGTGYSSLAYLKRFPADFLKMDNSFVASLGDARGISAADETIAGAIVSLAHALGMMVVGEGVENSGQLGVLRSLGCNLGQGNYFSGPLTGAAMDELLEQNPRW